MKRFPNSCIVLPIAAALAVLGCKGGGSDKADAGTEIAPVRVATVEAGTLTRRLGFIGDIEGQAEINVFSFVPDRLLAVDVEEGDRVKVGQTLAVVRASALGEGVKQAVAGVDAVRAQLESLQDQQARLKKLEGSGAVTSSQVLAVNAQVAAAEAQGRQFEAMLGQARQRRGDAVITAPVAGVIGKVFVEVGDIAAPQIPICTIVDLDRVKIIVRVPEPDLPLLAVGQPAEIEIAARPGEPVRGAVTRVGPVLDRLSRTASLEIDLENPGAALKPGMLARVRVEVERRDGVVWAPKDALTVTNEREGDKSLYRAVVIEGGKAKERLVLLGLEEAGRVEILKGLAAGETLVVAGQHLVVDGDPVRVVTDGAAPAIAPPAAPATPPAVAPAQAPARDGGA
jgi:RND family efflux transporter MFP subunit